MHKILKLHKKLEADTFWDGNKTIFANFFCKVNLQHYNQAKMMC